MPAKTIRKRPKTTKAPDPATRSLEKLIKAPDPARQSKTTPSRRQYVRIGPDPRKLSFERLIRTFLKAVDDYFVYYNLERNAQARANHEAKDSDDILAPAGFTEATLKTVVEHVQTKIDRKILLLQCGGLIAKRLEARGDDPTKVLAFINTVDFGGGATAAWPLYIDLRTWLDRLLIKAKVGGKASSNAQGIDDDPALEADATEEQLTDLQIYIMDYLNDGESATVEELQQLIEHRTKKSTSAIGRALRKLKKMGQVENTRGTGWCSTKNPPKPAPIPSKSS